MSILPKKKLIMLVLKYLPASVPLKVALFLFKNKTARKIVQKLWGARLLVSCLSARAYSAAKPQARTILFGRGLLKSTPESLSSVQKKDAV
ncbi:hypothetical protein [Rothia terrae]|uniref:Uncharacterized protein n=1 Tax=Rothia terrae TaxID=396015 RepID=A0A7H2BD14_9MICC|nr:hypothetical protein [Rothia terrae]QNV37560.1 hypothetical protein IDM49_10160 [Rothia terrae]